MKAVGKWIGILLALLLTVSVHAAEDESILTEYARAGEVLRQGMTERMECITVYFASADSDPNRVWQRIWSEALAHTGQPTAGDYLERQYDDLNVDYDYETVGSQRRYTFTFSLDYYTTAQQEAAVDAAVDTLLHKTLAIHDGMSDFEKIKAVYDWICTNVTNDAEHGDDYNLKRTAYAALIDRTAARQGYANLFYRLMLELGIDCRTIRGYTAEGSSRTWNIVRLGGVYYHVDFELYAAENGLDYDRFLCCEESFGNRTRREQYDSDSFRAAYPISETDFVPLMRGVCGTQASWTLDDQGLLTISGVGPMADYGSGYTLHRERITEVVVEEGITSIGRRGFENFRNLPRITLPDSLTAIGDHAFRKCKKLQAVQIGDGVAVIGDGAFASCTKLDSIVFGANVPVIGADAFAEVEAQAWYPANSDNWTADERLDYGGTLTWTAYAPGEAPEVNPIYTSDMAQAGAILRQGMVERKEQIEICLVSVETDYNTLQKTIWEEAVRHTGVPTEGDYLERQNGGYDLDLDWYELEGLRYYTLSYRIDFYTTAGQEDMVRAAVDTLLHKTLAIQDGMSDFEKIKMVYDWICAEVSYDSAHRGDDSYPLARTAYGALIDRTAVCQGYSLLMYRLMLELGIDCRVIRGQERDGTSPYWNIVRLDDVYYNLDPTEDAGSAPDKYRWFLLSDESLNLLEDRPRREVYASEHFYAAYPMSGTDYIWQRGTPGDLDGDGQVTADDAIYLLYHTLFGDVYPVDQSCDYDGSGTVDADDAIYLLYCTLFGETLYPLNA